MDIVVIGASGHAKVVIDLIEKHGQYRIAGLVDSLRQIGESFYGYTVLGRIQDMKNIIDKKEIFGCVIAIGDNCERKKVYDSLLALNIDCNFISVIHPSAQIARGVKIGSGSVVMAGVVINSDAEVGNFCIINTAATVDHDCKIGNFSSLSPRVSLAGNVTVGECTAIGIGSSVIEKVYIGNHVVIGAGSVVNDNVADNVVAYGVPAKKVRKRQIGEKYLR